jgi:uncharacterized protein DUF29
MGTNTQLYDLDFYLWCLDTCATLGAREFEALDIYHLIEEIRDLGNNLKSVLESDLCQVLLHLLKWRYQPQGRVDSHSWQDSIEEHRERISRLLAKSPSLKSHLPVIWPEEYRRARRKAQRQTGLPLSTFPEVCPWTAAQVLDEEFWPEAPAGLREGV